MKKFEYRIEFFDAKAFGLGRMDSSAMTKSLNDLGSEGWELVTTTWQTSFLTPYFVCVFKREIEE